MLQSGTPLELDNNSVFNVFNGSSPAHVRSYEGWTVARDNPNWLGSDRFFQPAASFGVQDRTRPGNATRHNPKARTIPNFVHNLSLARSFALAERWRLDFRAEAFNFFNNPRFATGSRNLDDPNFGVVRSTINERRRLQFALKLYF